MLAACAVKIHEDIVIEEACLLSLNLFGTLCACMLGKIDSNHAYFGTFSRHDPVWG